MPRQSGSSSRQPAWTTSVKWVWRMRSSRTRMTRSENRISAGRELVAAGRQDGRERRLLSERGGAVRSAPRRTARQRRDTMASEKSPNPQDQRRHESSSRSPIAEPESSKRRRCDDQDQQLRLHGQPALPRGTRSKQQKRTTQWTFRRQQSRSAIVLPRLL